MNQLAFDPFAPPSAPTKPKKGGFLFPVLALLLAGGLAWGGYYVATQIRAERNREFLTQVVERHLRDQRPVREHLGTVEAVAINDIETARLAEQGAVVFDVRGSQGNGLAMGYQQ
ncbi:MAG: hypothetical protein KDA58_01165, partial [Planctomycetaceae bacterium]|nr:hypothetical protein [Planctomycetaceae bacterium]